MSEADKAYEAALKEIERARAAGEIGLSFDAMAFRTLERIPPEVAGIDGLKRLDLDNTQVSDLVPLRELTGLKTLRLDRTQVSDLSPLFELTGLQWLYLKQTQVSNLAPLKALTKLQMLWLDQTQVHDLRPIRNLPALGERGSGGLRFKDTPAASATPDLARLSQIENDQERTLETQAYLRTLPPWPEPLPWQTPQGARSDSPPAPPEPDPVPRLILTGDMLLDLDHSRATPDDLSDPIKERLYRQLPDAARNLARFGNHYVEVKDPAERLIELTEADFRDADLLDIHLQIAALSDLREADPDRRENERFDADCMTALNKVLRLGPPVTMGHPDVDLFEKRSLDYARTRRPATEAEGERRIVGGLADADAITTRRLRDTAGMLRNAGDTGRVADYRTSFARNAIIALSALDAAVGGQIAGTVLIEAAHFLLLHKEAIMATAPAWGETGYLWASDLIRRADLWLKENANRTD